MVLKNKTSGMATTCYEYLKNYNKSNPILISSCDYAVIFDEKKLKDTISFFNHSYNQDFRKKFFSLVNPLIIN